MLRTLLFLMLTSWGVNPMPRYTLQVEVSGVTETSGPLIIGLYRSSDPFPDSGSAFRGEVVEVTRTGTQIISLSGLLPDTYAIAVYQDLNRNGKLDTGIFGIPSEPYGFSGSPVSRWRSPAFSEASFQLTNDGQIEPVILQKWSNH